MGIFVTLLELRWNLIYIKIEKNKGTIFLDSPDRNHPKTKIEVEVWVGEPVIFHDDEYQFRLSVSSIRLGNQFNRFLSGSDDRKASIRLERQRRGLEIRKGHAVLDEKLSPK